MRSSPIAFLAARRLSGLLLAALLLLPATLSAAQLVLDDYPRGNRLMLAQVSVRVEPEREARLTAPVAGMLQLNVTEREGRLPAGAIIGVMDQGRLELEEQLHELETIRAEPRRTAEWRLEQQTRTTALAERLTQLERQYDLLGRIEADTEISRLYLGDRSREESASNFAERRARLRADIDLIRAVLVPLADEETEEQHLEIERLKRLQREMELERRRALSTVEMPFDGRYRLQFPLLRDQSVYRVEAGQEIAHFQDTRRFYAAAPVQSAEWRIHPKERLALTLQAGDATRIEGRFHTEREVLARNQPELLYVFHIPETESEAAAGLVGGLVSATLWLEIGEVARMIPKLELAIAHPDVFREKSWAEGARELFPTAARVVAGATHIAIVPAR